MGRNLWIVFFTGMNLCTFLVYGWDKRCAVKGKWRVSERTLILFAAAGGSIGALLGMRVFRHKTRKNKFRFGVPVILILQITLAAGLAFLLQIC